MQNADGQHAIHDAPLAKNAESQLKQKRVEAGILFCPFRAFPKPIIFFRQQNSLFRQLWLLFRQVGSLFRQVGSYSLVSTFASLWQSSWISAIRLHRFITAFSSAKFKIAVPLSAAGTQRTTDICRSVQRRYIILISAFSSWWQAELQRLHNGWHGRAARQSRDRIPASD